MKLLAVPLLVSLSASFMVSAQGPAPYPKFPAEGNAILNFDGVSVTQFHFIPDGVKCGGIQHIPEALDPLAREDKTFVMQGEAKTGTPTILSGLFSTGRYSPDFDSKSDKPRRAKTGTPTILSGLVSTGRLSPDFDSKSDKARRAANAAHGQFSLAGLALPGSAQPTDAAKPCPFNHCWPIRCASVISASTLPTARQ